MEHHDGWSFFGWCLLVVLLSLQPRQSLGATALPHGPNHLALEIDTTGHVLGTRHAPAAVNNATVGPDASLLIRRQTAEMHLPDREPWKYWQLFVLEVSSFAFIVPAIYAWLKHWYWLAVLFFLQVLVCVFYHFCDAEGPQLLFGSMSVCTDVVARSLLHADHGLAYFMFQQMALVILGPEDPVLQRAEQAWRQTLELTNKEENKCRLGDLVVPRNLVLLGRLGTACAMFLFLLTYSSWANFHWECTIWCTVVLILDVSGFWLLRPSYASGVLFRRKFWLRVFKSIGLPFLLSLILFISMETIGNPAWLHAAWHVVVSVLAIFGMWKISKGSEIDFGEGDPVRNPMVAHNILFAIPVLGFTTVMLTILVDSFAHPLDNARFQWPTISKAAARPPAGYVFALGSVLIATTAGATWRVIDLVGAFHEEEEGPAMSVMASNLRTLRRPAICLGYMATFAGFFLAMSSESGPVNANIHGVPAVILFFLLQITAILLATASTFSFAAPSQTTKWWRLGLGVLPVLALFVKTVFTLMHQFAGKKSSMLHWVFTLLVNASFVLHLVWPLSWYRETEDALTFWVQRSRVLPNWDGCLKDLRACDTQ